MKKATGGSTAKSRYARKFVRANALEERAGTNRPRAIARTRSGKKAPLNGTRQR